MYNYEHLQNRLRHKEIILMDGAMGTEILRRGVPTTLPLWSAEALLTHPEVVQRIHEDAIAAGAEIIITNTFRTTSWTFAKKAQAEKARDMTLRACQLVHQAIDRLQPAHPVYSAGSMAPLEDCYSPELTPSNEHLAREHYLYASDLKAGGVDFLLLETMITLRETMAAIQAAKKLAMPFAVSFCTNPQTTLLGGETLENVLKEVEQYDPLFIGVNCVSPETATRALQALRQLTNRPLSVYAQGDGIPDNNQGWQFNEAAGIEHYVTCAQRWLQEGAQIIGGCCGTSPAYIERLRRLF